MKTLQPIHILLVEDNEGDIMLTQEAFEDAGLAIEMTLIRDGRDAIDFMSKSGKYSNTALPDLVLLDINLPKVSGLEVLTFIKGNDSTKHTPVIMLTTSNYEKDLKNARLSNADGYINKPLLIDEFLEVTSGIDSLIVLNNMKFKLNGYSND
jgi:CheY-like chemotaxis protein